MTARAAVAAALTETEDGLVNAALQLLRTEIRGATRYDAACSTTKGP